jgi:hypothetical protein
MPHAWPLRRHPDLRGGTRASREPGRFRPVKSLNRPPELFGHRRRHLRQSSKRSGSTQPRGRLIVERAAYELLGAALGDRSGVLSLSRKKSRGTFWGTAQRDAFCAPIQEHRNLREVEATAIDRKSSRRNFSVCKLLKRKGSGERGRNRTYNLLIKSNAVGRVFAYPNTV